MVPKTVPLLNIGRRRTVGESPINGEITKQYFFGRRTQSDWKVGSPFKLLTEDGRIDISFLL